MRWSNEQRAFAVEAYFSKKEVSLPHPVYTRRGLVARKELLYFIFNMKA
jgi:hypothetical protein